MNKENCEFKFSDSIEIIFESFDSIVKLLPLYDARIILKNNNSTWLLADYCIKDLLEIFTFFLNKGLTNNLHLHPSIIENIGLMWNKELHNEQGLAYEENDEGQSFWVGLRNSLWQTPGYIDPNLATWLYNDKDGNIIFEVTPNYPWHFDDPEPNKKFITYEEFMKNYKSIFIRTLPRDVARKWLAQAEFLLKLVEDNEKNIRNKYLKAKNSC